MAKTMTNETEGSKKIMNGKMVTREFMISYSNLCDIGDTFFTFPVGSILYKVCESITDLHSYEDPSINCCFIKCTLDENDIHRLERAKFTLIKDRTNDSVNEALVKQNELSKKYLSPMERFELFDDMKFTLDPFKLAYKERNNSGAFVLNSRENR